MVIPLSTPINATELLGSADGPFTFEGLFKWDGGGPDTNRFLFKGTTVNGNDDGNSILRVVLNNPGNNPTFAIGLPNGDTFTTTAGAIPNLVGSDWYHMALTFDGNNAAGSDAKFYWTTLDPSTPEANLVHTFSSASTTTYDIKAFQIGNWNRSNFQGLVDEFRISNIARTPDDMLFGGSIFQITQVVREGSGAVTLTFTSSAGAFYAVDASTDLETWLELNDSVTGESGETVFTDDVFATPPAPDPALDEVFYRVRRL